MSKIKSETLENIVDSAPTVAYLNDEARQKLWDDYEKIESKIKGLKFILQNPTGIHYTDIEKHHEETLQVVEALKAVHNDLLSSVHVMSFSEDFEGDLINVISLADGA